MKQIKLYLLVGCVAFTQSACSYPAQDELECVLPNGDKFELVAKYDYEPLSEVLQYVGDVAQRLNQQDFEVRHKSSNGEYAGDSIDQISKRGREQLSTEDGRIKTCSEFSLIRDTYTTPRRVRLPSGATSKDFQTINRPAIQFDAIKKLAASKGFQFYFPSRGYFGLFDSKLIMERPLINLNVELDFTQPIEGVFQIASADNGQTWSEPIVTKESKLFVIGKSLFDQLGIAKPGKYKIGPGR
jgi:hypothetical protein